MAEIRLHKFMSECGVASRRASEKLIIEGVVSVNGKVVTEPGSKIDPEKDSVIVKGEKLKSERKGILILNKPEGVISTKSDTRDRKIVMDFLPEKYKHYHPVGRLDYESSGLMVFTNDGELSQRLLHPRHEMDRIYRVRVNGTPKGVTLRELKKGIKLEDGPVKADVRIEKEVKQSSWLIVRIRIGRKRIVRHMLRAVGHPVTKLIRISHGPFQLGNLREGEVKVFNEKEYQKLREMVFSKRSLS